MSDGTEEQISQWLKKLERESWQLELLVSAFTIFLLIGANKNFGEYLIDLNYKYSFESFLGLAVFFLSLIYTSIQVLTAFLVIHLLLRGFWIGAIGLRSVQPSIAYEKLNYSEFFMEKLKKKVIGLDRLVVILDELCSVIFSLSFLIIFMILSFGLYFLFLGVVSVLLVSVMRLFSDEPNSIMIGILASSTITIFITGLVYLIDYFTLGFIKKVKWLNKVYYPIYKFYSAITLSFISRSIYYNLISKYSKKKIRFFYLILIGLVMTSALVNFDQYQYYPEGETDLVVERNYYDDSRNEEEYVEKVSVESKFISGSFMSLFIRYDPRDNEKIQSNCSDFEPLKKDGFNARMKFIVEDGGFFIRTERFEDEDKDRLLACLHSFYQVSINDSTYREIKYYFHQHPLKSQKGILAVISTEGFLPGENIVKIGQSYMDSSDSTQVVDDFATFPVWFSSN